MRGRPAYVLLLAVGVAPVKGVPTACEGFGHYGNNAGILSKNGGHHAIPHRKQPLEMIFSNFFQKSIFPLQTLRNVNFVSYYISM